MTEYERFIEFNRTRDQGKYVHRHHIIPKSMGGTDDESNLITLSWLTHYYAHYLLAKEHPENKGLQKYFKRKGTMDDWLHWCYLGYKYQTDKTTHPFYGKHHSEETKAKISEANKGKAFTEKQRKNLSEAMKGNTNSKRPHSYTKRKVEPPKSEEWKRKHSEAMKRHWAKRKQKTC